MYILSPLKFCKCALKEDILVQNQLNGWEDIEEVILHKGLSYIPKMIKIRLTSYFGIDTT